MYMYLSACTHIGPYIPVHLSRTVRMHTGCLSQYTVTLPVPLQHQTSSTGDSGRVEAKPPAALPRARSRSRMGLSWAARPCGWSIAIRASAAASRSRRPPPREDAGAWGWARDRWSRSGPSPQLLQPQHEDFHPPKITCIFFLLKCHCWVFSLQTAVGVLRGGWGWGHAPLRCL